MMVLLRVFTIIMSVCLVSYRNIFSCSSKRNSSANNERGKGFIQIQKKKITVKYDDVKDLKSIDISSELDGEDVLKVCVKSYYDSIRNSKKIDCLDISTKYINSIKKILYSILKFTESDSDEYYKKLCGIIDSVFVKIEKYSSNVFNSEGIKDQLLFCFLMSRIKNVLENVEKGKKYTSNDVSKLLSYNDLIKKYDGKFYSIVNGDDKFEYIVNFNDQTLYNSVCDILNYIKSCFFAYSIFVCNKVIEVFPMLSIGEMKIKDNLTVSIFDNERDDVNVSYFFEKMECGTGNHKIAYIYRQVLNSSLELNKKLFEKLSNVKNDGFECVKGLNKFLYNVKKSDSYCTFFSFISYFKNHKLYDSLIGIYNLRVKEKGAKTTYFVRDIFSGEKSSCEIKFNDSYTKRIDPDKIKYILCY